MQAVAIYLSLQLYALALGNDTHDSCTISTWVLPTCGHIFTKYNGIFALRECLWTCRSSSIVANMDSFKPLSVAFEDLRHLTPLQAVASLGSIVSAFSDIQTFSIPRQLTTRTMHSS